MGEDQLNPLLSTQKSSDSLPAVLHPLVLLTISDYITRHTLRQQKGPIVGALLGQQNGREITIEHAFEGLTKASENGDVLLSQPWFTHRLEQMKTVHKDRQLDLVGWYTLLPRSGPTPDILPLHNQILSNFNESAVLLAFHPDELLDHSVGGKLPLTIYESNSEVDDANKETAHPEGEDKEMKDGESPEATFKMKFRELLYTVETGEAEMISIDFVARGTANATAVDSRGKKVAVEADTKGKRRAVAKEAETPAADENYLSREDEELISSLTTKANATKMLHSRIQLITKYLEQLPPSYLSADDQSAPAKADSAADGKHAPPSNNILRSIQALVNRLSILNPSSAEAFEKEALSESNDVHLVSLLNDVMQSIGDVREIGKKFSIIEQAKNSKSRMDYSGASNMHSAFTIPGAGDLLG